jgi:hypothetical protein
MKNEKIFMDENERETLGNVPKTFRLVVESHPNHRSQMESPL